MKRWLLAAALAGLFLFVVNFSIAPSLLPAGSELLPPSADSDIRSISKNFQSRKDIIVRYLDQLTSSAQLPISSLWWAQYRKAQALVDLDKDRSCQLFLDLSKDKRFPLHSLAKINAEKNCGLEISKPDPQMSELNKKLVDIQLEKALNEGNHPLSVDLLVKKSKKSVVAEEKVKLMIQAFDIAKKHKLKNLNEIEKRLYKISPSRIPQPNRLQYLDVAKDFSQLRQFKTARIYYRKVIKDKRASLGDKIIAYKGLRQSYKLQLDRERSLRETVKLEQFVYNRFKKRGLSKWECSVYTPVNILLARTQWTEHRADLGKKTLDKLINKCTGKTNLAFANWILGRMSEEKQDFKQAIKNYDIAKQGVRKGSDLFERVLWSLAWANYKNSDYKKSQMDLLELDALNEGGLSGEKYKFWLAMTYKKLKDEAAAKKIFNKLIESAPLSYYSYLSQRELGLELKKTDILTRLSAKDTVYPPQDLLEYYDPIYFQWLLATSETEIAKNYLSTVSKNFRASRSKDSLDSWIFILNQFSELESYTSVFQKLASLEDALRREIFHNYHHLIFPMPFNDVVLSSSARFGVRPEYIYAIMRQESAFDPNARSHMDAFGLMQLLPEVAKQTAEKNGIAFNEPNDLYDPETSILIGTSHLRELMDRYDGKFVLAIASYNANERAIQNWLATRYKGNTIEFIEDIPYQETSTYVKLVLRNLYTYSLFKSDTATTAFPEWSLAMEP